MINISLEELEPRLRQDVKKMMADILKIQQDKLTEDDNFSEFGFDSITLKDFADKLNERYTLDLIPSVFFDYGTLETLCAFLVEEYTDDLKAYYVEQTSTQPAPAPQQSSPKEVLAVSPISTTDNVSSASSIEKDPSLNARPAPVVSIQEITIDNTRSVNAQSEKSILTLMSL